MIARCTNKRSISYEHYGGRGIKVCERWRKFENFFADMGERPDGMTLDRGHPSDPYSPECCKWENASNQRKNRRRFKTMFYCQWCGVEVIHRDVDAPKYLLCEECLQFGRKDVGVEMRGEERL